MNKPADKQKLLYVGGVAIIIVVLGAIVRWINTDPRPPQVPPVLTQPWDATSIQPALESKSVEPVKPSGDSINITPLPDLPSGDTYEITPLPTPPPATFEQLPSLKSGEPNEAIEIQALPPLNPSAPALDGATSQEPPTSSDLPIRTDAQPDPQPPAAPNGENVDDALERESEFNIRISRSVSESMFVFGRPNV